MTGGGPSPPAPSSPSQLAALRTTISHPQQQLTLTCYIPPSKIGAVIGRGGKTIVNLQREASRRSNHPNSIRMSVASNSPEQQLWTPVIIRGDPVGCFAAAELLLPLVEEEMDDVVLDVPIQRSKHSAIIGRRGGTIAVLSADHNVRIMVPSGRSAGADQPLFSEKENLNMIQLEGELGDVEKCLIKLLQIVGEGSDGNQVEKVVTAPTGREDLVPSLARLRQIGKKTNTIVRRKRIEKNEEVETQFTISGRLDCVEAAVTLFGKMFVGEEQESKEEQKKNANQTNLGHQNSRGRAKNSRSGRGGSGRGSGSKSFSQRGGRGRGAAAVSPATAS